MKLEKEQNHETAEITVIFTTIPPITDPMGRYWDQPNSDNILLDDSSAVMSREDFDRLAEYSTTIPTGKYIGKMWKAKRGGKWFLCWYDKDPQPGYLAIPHREIFLCD